MIKIYDNGFTETLWRYIKKISLKALSMITPANFLYITESKLKDIDQSDLFFTNNSVVNSTQMDAVNSAIAYTRPNNIETTTLTQTVTDAEIRANLGNEDYYIISFFVPEGYDGRNCFPYIDIDGFDTFTAGDKIYTYLYVGPKTDGIAGHVISLNSDRIEIKFWIGVNTLGTLPDFTINLELWRNK